MELQSKPRSKEIRQRAWNALGAGSYWPFVGGNLVLNIISAFAMMVPLLIMVFVCAFIAGALGFPPENGQLLDPIPWGMIATVLVAATVLSVPWTYIIGFSSWGTSAMSLGAADRNFKFELCLSGYGHGWRMAWTVLVQWTYITLWYFLLIIPGILKTFSYAMTTYVQIDHPDWGANRCIEESMRLMRGNRWRLFKLGFSFIGWILLFLLVAPFGGSGLAQIFFAPYPMTAIACFYRQLLIEKGPASAL